MDKAITSAIQHQEDGQERFVYHNGAHGRILHLGRTEDRARPQVHMQERGLSRDHRLHRASALQAPPHEGPELDCPADSVWVRRWGRAEVQRRRHDKQRDVAWGTRRRTTSWITAMTESKARGAPCVSSAIPPDQSTR